MSPELKEIYYDKIDEINFNPEKFDLFLLAVTFLQSIVILMKIIFNIK